MDRLTAIKVFVAVVEHGSLSKAAKHMEIHPAMASRYLTALENWLEVRLVHRTTRRISLTEAGLIALQPCRDLLESSFAMECSIAKLRHKPKGRVRLSTTHIFGEQELVPALIKFCEQYPEIEITLITSDIPPSNLASENLDLSIRPKCIQDSTLTSVLLGKWPMILCATPQYLDKHGTPDTTENLKLFDFISHANFETKDLTIHTNNSLYELNFRSILSCTEASVIRCAVLSGLGIALLPLYCIENDLKNGNLVKILPDIELFSTDIYIEYSPQPRNHLALLINHLIENLSPIKNQPLE